MKILSEKELNKMCNLLNRSKLLQIDAHNKEKSGELYLEENAAQYINESVEIHSKLLSIFRQDELSFFTTTIDFFGNHNKMLYLV